MDSDIRGDMGFMESMVAMMAVVTVLAAFIGVAAHATVVLTDPTEGLDGEMLTGTVVDGMFVPSYEDYVVEYAESRGLSGISVSVTVPGGFCGVPEPLIHGTFDGEVHSRTVTSTVDAGDGRTIVAVFEVTACARAGTASWRWPTPPCS